MRSARPRAPRAPRRHEEHDQQCMLIKWCATFEHKYPALRNIFAIPNAGVAGGARRGGWLRAEGVKAGVPDLLLAWPMNGNNNRLFSMAGLWIEMKTATGRVSPEQKEWHEQLRRSGYAVAVCRSAEEAIETISKYLGIPTA